MTSLNNKPKKTRNSKLALMIYGIIKDNPNITGNRLREILAKKMKEPLYDKDRSIHTRARDRLSNKIGRVIRRLESQGIIGENQEFYIVRVGRPKTYHIMPTPEELEKQIKEINSMFKDKQTKMMT